MKNLLYLCILIASAVLFFNMSSVIYYIIAIIITLVLFYYNFIFINRFKELSSLKKVATVFGVLISLLVVFVFYFVAHGYLNICTVGQGVRAKNYFTGEYKEFYCGITPWYYYEKITGKDNYQFPIISNEIEKL